MPTLEMKPQEVQLSPVQVVGQINGNEHPSGRGVDAHVVRGVVQELGPGVALDVVGVVVAPAQLNVNPVLLGGGAVHHIPEEKASQQEFILHKTPL